MKSLQACLVFIFKKYKPHELISLVALLLAIISVSTVFLMIDKI